MSKLKAPAWLAHFSLGDLYAREEFGAPSDDDQDRPHHDSTPEHQFVQRVETW